MEKTVKWYEKEVKWGFFVKFMITLNILCLCICFRFAYISDIIEEDEEEYIQYLETRVELQSELLEAYRKLIWEEK